MSKLGYSILALTLTATAALTGRRFCTNAGAVGTAGAAALGVNKSDAAIGEKVAVDVLGTAVVEAGAAIAADAYISVGAAGKAVTYVDGDVCMGRLCPGETAAADGSLVEVLLLPARPLQVIS